MADTDVRCHGACVYSGCSVVFVTVLLQCTDTIRTLLGNRIRVFDWYWGRWPWM